MINVKINTSKELKDIEKKLGSMKSKAPKVLSDAVNDTAKDARRILAKQAKQEYAVMASRFQKSMSIKKANPSKPSAIVKSKGNQLEVIDFKTNTKTPGEADMVRAKVYKKGGLKNLVKAHAEKNGKDLKAFIVKYKSGHVTVAQRVPGELTTRKVVKNGKEYSYKAEKIRTLPAPAVPQMLKNEEKVYLTAQIEIKAKLKENIDKRVGKVLMKK